MMDMETATALAQASYSKDRMFRRYVDAAVHEAMRHAEHIPEGEIDRRDLHHVAVAAAMAVLRFAIDGDHMLKSMEFERDAATKLAKDAAMRFPGMLVMHTPPED
jgi:hypothetical protein